MCDVVMMNEVYLVRRPFWNVQTPSTLPKIKEKKKTTQGDEIQADFSPHIDSQQGLSLEKLPLNLEGFKQRIIIWRAALCRLLKIIIIKKKKNQQTLDLKLQPMPEIHS